MTEVVDAIGKRPGTIEALLIDRSRVIRAMATFAWQTGSFVIAEGIEDPETLTFLRGIDDHDLRAGHVIQGGQGFGLGVPSEELVTEPPTILTHEDEVPTA